jgi:3-phenylpropionate/trans-cinnamate dioxygenase ferredoxin reductase component
MGGPVVTRSGRPTACDQLLTATGGRNRTLDVPGADLDGVLQLRTQADCERIRAVALRGEAGCDRRHELYRFEVAASLTQLGVRVTAVFPDVAPLARVLGPEVGTVLGHIHQEKGVELVAADRLAAFEGRGRVEAVLTRSGRRLDCSAAIAAVGIQPNVDLLTGSGISLENGVLVDEMCRTNVPGVFACGDVANMAHPLFGRVRVEHYNNAEKHGRAAARSIMGRGEPYEYVFSSGPTSTTTRSSMSASPNTGTSWWSAAAWMTRGSWASTWSRAATGCGRLESWRRPGA